MATKWADYLISAVQYNYAGTHIAKVRRHPDNGDTIGNSTDVLRSSVVSQLEAGTTFATITKEGTKWIFGASVEVITVEGQNTSARSETRPGRTTSANCHGSDA